MSLSDLWLGCRLVWALACDMAFVLAFAFVVLQVFVVADELLCAWVAR